MFRFTKNIILMGLLLFSSLAVSAQRAFTLSNSDDGNSELKVFLPAKETATGRAIVCCPGGGYSMVCMTYEGTEWAPYFNKLGIALVVVKYRMPKGDRSIPMGDAERAMRTVRDSADVWNINPQDVGIMGFSAGGHLASTVATHADDATRPNFQVLFYPVISMNKEKGHRGSSVNFLGRDVDNAQLIAQYSNDLQVKPSVTPPAIIFLADNDRTVPPLTNGLPYYMALKGHGVSASLHVYPTGGHGWRFDRRFPFHDEMLLTLENWLKQLKPKK